MKPIRNGGWQYLPAIRTDGRLTARAAVAYGGSGHRGQLMLSVYLLVTATKGVQMRTYEGVALRHYLPRETPPEAQRAYMEVMLDAVAVQQECELYVIEKGNPK